MIEATLEDSAPTTGATWDTIEADKASPVGMENGEKTRNSSYMVSQAVIMTKVGTSAPRLDGLCFTHLQFLLGTAIGKIIFPESIRPFWKRVVDDPNAFPSEFRSPPSSVESYDPGGGRSNNQFLLVTRCFVILQRLLFARKPHPAEMKVLRVVWSCSFCRGSASWFADKGPPSGELPDNLA